MTMTFTTALWILLAAFFLPLVAAGVAKGGRRDYDNTDPRGWENRLEGHRRRAVAAMNNTFEALPFFAAAVIVAHQLGAPQGRLDALAAAWLVLRVVYLWLYVADKATARSIVWLGGIVVTVWIFVLGA
jgi:uncharacterized MAPEG superfamily protein